MSSTHKNKSPGVAGHRSRLRDRFLQNGFDGFHDYEVIELLLTLGTPRKDCKETAKSLIKQFKTLPGILEAPSDALIEVNGIGPQNLIGLKLIKSAADRYLKQKLVASDPINHSKALFEYLYHDMRDKQREHFKVIFLNIKNRVLAVETLFTGTLTSGIVYPREVVLAALTHHAATVIFAHNHPSGDPKPSREDIALTRKLLFACRTMEIRVHEHIIIGENCYYSFADHQQIVRMHSAYDAQMKMAK